MVSMKLAVSTLVAMLVVVQAAPNINNFGGPQQGNFGGPQQGNFGGQQTTGFRNGIGQQGGRFSARGGQGGPMPQGSMVQGSMVQGGPMMPQGGPGGNGWNMGQNCRAPTCYTPQTTNDTINQINTLWNTTYVAGTTNCTTIQEQEEAIVKAANDQYVAAQVAANLNGTALTVYNLFKTAYDAFASSTPDVQKQLIKFEIQLLMEGGPGPSEFCPRNNMNRPGK